MTNAFENPCTEKPCDAPSYWKCAKYPKVTSPAEICVRPGETTLHQVTYKAKEPYPLTMIGYGPRPVPDGVVFDEKTGVVSVSIPVCGTYFVTFVMRNEKGRIVQWGDLKIKVMNGRRQPPALAGETFYQLQIPGFTKSADFAGVRSHLRRLADLGVTWVYLSPVTAADRGTDRLYWSNRQRGCGANNPANPYRPADYFHVDPAYGTDDEFRELVSYAHSLGLKIMTDVVIFHCGPNAVFLKDHPEWVVRDAEGKMVRNEWCFPKLNIADPVLRKYLKDSLLMWALDYGVDGYRCDCGCDTPLDFWEDVAAAIDARKDDFVWLLEGADVTYGEKAFNIFYGFIACHGGVNVSLDGREPASIVREQWQAEKSRGPAGSFYMRGTDTHDIANNDGDERQELRWGHRRAEAALALCFALDGPVMLWQGQEIGWDQPYCIFSYTVPDWDHPPVPGRAEVIRRLAMLKKTEPAFGSCGRLVWLEPENPDDQVLFERIAPDGTTWRCFFDLATGDWSIGK